MLPYTQQYVDIKYVFLEYSRLSILGYVYYIWTAMYRANFRPASACKRVHDVRLDSRIRIASAQVSSMQSAVGVCGHVQAHRSEFEPSLSLVEHALSRARPTPDPRHSAERRPGRCRQGGLNRAGQGKRGGVRAALEHQLEPGW